MPDEETSTTDETAAPESAPFSGLNDGAADVDPLVQLVADSAMRFAINGLFEIAGRAAALEELAWEFAGMVDLDEYGQELQRVLIRRYRAGYANELSGAAALWEAAGRFADVHALDADELALDAGLQPFLDRLAAEAPEIDLAEVDAQFGHLAQWSALEMRALFDDLPDSEVPVRDLLGDLPDSESSDPTTVPDHEEF